MLQAHNYGVPEVVPITRICRRTTFGWMQNRRKCLLFRHVQPYDRETKPDAVRSHPNASVDAISQRTGQRTVRHV